MADSGELLSQNSYLNFTSRSYSIDLISKSFKVVKGPCFCDFCSIEMFKSKKQWSHNIQKSFHSFETIITINSHSALRGRQPTNFSFLRKMVMKRAITLFSSTKKISLFKMSLRIKLKTKFIEPSFRYTPANHKFAVRQSWTVKLNQNITN